MYRCIRRDQPRLKPHELLSLIENYTAKYRGTLNEVMIRRIISMIYLSLFNYWAEKIYIRGGRGEDFCQDMFRYSQFHREMISYGLDHAMFILYVYRTASDHYILNPTYIELKDPNWKGIRISVEINFNVLLEMLKLSRELLKALDEY